MRPEARPPPWSGAVSLMPGPFLLLFTQVTGSSIVKHGHRCGSGDRVSDSAELDSKEKRMSHEVQGFKEYSVATELWLIMFGFY